MLQHNTCKNSVIRGQAADQRVILFIFLSAVTIKKCQRNEWHSISLRFAAYFWGCPTTIMNIHMSSHDSILLSL